MTPKSQPCVLPEGREGTVTALVPVRGQAGLVHLHLDGAFALAVDRRTVAGLGIRAGARLDAAAWQRLCAAEAQRKAHEMALQYVARAPRTQEEVRRRLLSTGFAEDVAAAALHKLREAHYVDDAVYARQYVENRFQDRGFGPARLHAELRRRGVAEDIAWQAAVNLAASEDMLEAARRAAEKRWPRLARAGDLHGATRKLAGHLARRGYATETVRKVVEEFRGRHGS